MMEFSAPTPAPQRLFSAPVPEGIVLAEIPESDPSPKESASILVLERHTNLLSREVLTRTVRRLHTPQGVQDQSRVELVFDPASEEITLHYLQVIRNGVARESVDVSDFRIIQRETQLEAHIQDGHLSAIAHLEDVRAGDIIDLAFTTRNRVPVFKDRYFFGFTLGWPFPITEVRVSATLPPASPIILRNTGLGSEPHRENIADGSERLVWQFQNPKPVPPDSSIPSWHIPVPYVQASDFADWNEVAVLTYRLWEPSLRSAGQSPAFLELVTEWKAKHASPEAYAETAIRFVQDQVRYLGIEEGTRSYVPESPDKVLARRYGDCKDKSLLLCALLRANGITAWPVLVNSQLQHTIAGFLPSPAAFDHAIVCIRIDKNYAWVDPTIPAQGGTLATRVLPRFVQGLIVHPKSKGLVKLPKPTPDSGELIVEEDYAIDYRGKSARLTSATTYSGTQADGLRQALARAGHEETAKEFLRSTENLFPGATRDCPLEIEDDRDANRIVVKDRYRIPDFIATIPRSRQEVLRLPGHVIARILVGTSETKREHPLHLPFPNRLLHSITASLPTGIAVEKSRETIDAPGFVFSSRTRPTHNGIEVRYSYGATANRVEPADLPLYMSKLHRVSDALGFVFPLPRHRRMPKNAKTFLSFGATFVVVAVFALLAKLVIGDSSRRPANQDPLWDDGDTLTTIEELQEDSAKPDFEQLPTSGTEEILTNSGTIDIGGPSLLDAREFDLSLDPSDAQTTTRSRIEGLPSLNE